MNRHAPGHALEHPGELVLRLTTTDSASWVNIQYDHPDADSCITVGKLTNLPPGKVLDLGALAGSGFVVVTGSTPYDEGTYSTITDTTIYKNVSRLNAGSLRVAAYNNSIFIFTYGDPLLAVAV